MTLKVGMQHWVLKYYQVCSSDDPGMTLTYCMARTNLVLYAFVREKVIQLYNVFFSETIVVYDIKIGRCSQLNEYMKLYEYQRSIIHSTITWPFAAKFYVESPWDEGTKAFSNCLGHMTKMATIFGLQGVPKWAQIRVWWGKARQVATYLLKVRVPLYLRCA